MAVRKRRTKILLALLSVVLLPAVLLAGLPIWFPWVLRPIAKRHGATYTDYHRVGYARFQLSDLAITNGSTRLQAQEVSALVPSIWLWRHLTGQRDQQFIGVRSWKYSAAQTPS